MIKSLQFYVFKIILAQHVSTMSQDFIEQNYGKKVSFRSFYLLYK